MRTVLSIILLSALPASAGAQDVVVMSLGGDAPPAAAREAREAIAASLASDGLEVLPDADLGLRIPPSRLAACASSACAFAIGREVGVSMVAAVATWMTDGQVSSLTLSLIVGPDRSHTGTEEVGETGLAAAARAAVAAAQASRRRALIIEGTSAPPVSYETGDGDGEDSGETDPTLGADVLHSERSLEEWILPSLLGFVGLALVGTSVYAMLGETCDRLGGSGICLAGSRPNYGLGVTFAVVGSLSIVGALIWLIVGGQPGRMDPIDIILGPDGTGARF